MRRTWRWLRFVLLSVFVAALIYSGINIGSYLIEAEDEQQTLIDVRQVYAQALSGDDTQSADDTQNEPSGLEDAAPELAMKAYEALVSVNADAAGWISIAGTDIDHPFAQAQDNSYYLDRSFLDERSAHGCIFMDYRNSVDDRHIILYGHDMKDGSMFGGLSMYEDETYFAQHSDITLNLQGTLTRWKIFNVHAAGSDMMPVKFTNDEEFRDWLSSLKEQSLFDTGIKVSTADTVLTLSTCGSGSNKRFVIHAKRIDESG